MVSEFDSRVYAAVSRVPRGRVSTYAAIASSIGCGSARAVGQALKRNPFAPEVPCHRIIRSDLTIGGFKGKVKGGAIACKIELLKTEGVFFRNGALVDRTLVI